MSDEPEVLVRIEGAVGRITLNRPGTLHALTTKMCRLAITYRVAVRAVPRRDLLQGARAGLVKKAGVSAWDPPTLEVVTEETLGQIVVRLGSSNGWTPCLSEVA